MQEPHHQAGLAHGPRSAFSLRLFAGLSLLVAPPILFALSWGLVRGVDYLSDRPTAVICGWLLIVIASVGGVGDVVHLLNGRGYSKIIITIFALATLILFSVSCFMGLSFAIGTVGGGG